MRFDWVSLHTGVDDNNLVLAELRLEVEAEARDGRVTIRGTGQSWPLRSGTPKTDGPSKLRFYDWTTPAKTHVVIEE